jgi:hypothetical protein
VGSYIREDKYGGKQQQRSADQVPQVMADDEEF